MSKVINIGHLPGHVNSKTEKLKEAGYINASGIITLESTPELIKQELFNSPNSLFIVGGAMMKTYPDLMNEVIEYIKIDCPTIIVHNTTTDDFPEGC